MANAMVVKNEEYNSLGLEATELRLGLPGDAEAAKSSHGKRGFSETIDLKLKLQMGGIDDIAIADEENKMSDGQKSTVSAAKDPEKPPSKAQVVGWPPVRSYRKNIMAVHSEKAAKDDGEKSGNATAAATFVKVSMDGAPYLRKVDLKMYGNYRELSIALENMFSSFNIGSCGSHGMNGRSLMNESRLMDLLNGSDYVPTYEDKDGDWMLVGDVPWDMFVDSCKRLRVMKGSEAIGLAPRAMEKCKNRS